MAKFKLGAKPDFSAGKKLYARGKPMPPMPRDDEISTTKKSQLWVGWMLGRAADVYKIFAILDLVGLRDTKEGDRLTKKLVDALDRKLGFKRLT